MNSDHKQIVQVWGAMILALIIELLISTNWPTPKTESAPESPQTYAASGNQN